MGCGSSSEENTPPTAGEAAAPPAAAAPTEPPAAAAAPTEPPAAAPAAGYDAPSPPPASPEAPASPDAPDAPASPNAPDATPAALVKGPTTIDESWAVLDKDKSGTLTSGEVWKAVKAGFFSDLPGFAGLKSNDVCDLLDTNEGDDGVITKEEFAYAMRRIFKATHPGIPPPSAMGPLSKEEEEAKQPTTVDELWDALDTDKTGTLLSGEVWKGVKYGYFSIIPGFLGLTSGEVMDILDTDAGEDSVVTRAEFDVAMQTAFVKKNPGITLPPSMIPANGTKIDDTAMPISSAKELWDLLDADKSGALTSGEVWKGVKKDWFKFIPGFIGLKSGEVMDMLDTDAGEDSKVTEAEFYTYMQTAFTKSYPDAPLPPALDGTTKMPTTADELWAMMDKDGTGTLTSGEVWKGVKLELFAGIPGLAGLKSGKVMDILDTDAGEDSMITKDEFNKAMRGVFQASHPGVPPPSALGPRTKEEEEFKIPTTIEELWAILDKDKSGSLTAGEVWKGTKKGYFGMIPGFIGLKSGDIMDRMDTDAGEDAVVTEAEFRTSMEAQFPSTY